MALTENQADALAELVNIGYARAAGSLSQLTGYRISLEVPRVSLHPLSEIASMLSPAAQTTATAVSQVFTGPVSGNALLILDEHSASILVDLLTDDTSEFEFWPEDRREVMSEIGNIVLGACLGVFGNLLKVNVSFSVPLLHIADAQAILQSTTVGRENLSHGLLMLTQFHVRDQNVSGCLVIILGVTSLDRLLQGLRDWEMRSIRN
jgi:chemotaxis protein CheC